LQEKSYFAAMSQLSEEAAKHIEALKANPTSEQHTALVHKLLDTIDKEPAHWQFVLKENERTVAEGPLTGPVVALLRASLGAWGVAGGAGCPEKLGCANIGQRGQVCLYLCHTVAYHG
jgi:hypothetical protein